MTQKKNNCIPELPIWKHETQDVYFWIGPSREDYINKERTRACAAVPRGSADAGALDAVNQNWADRNWCGYLDARGEGTETKVYVAYIGGPGERHKPDIYYLTSTGGTFWWLGLERGGLGNNTANVGSDDYFKLKTVYLTGATAFDDTETLTPTGISHLSKFQDTQTPKPLFIGRYNNDTNLPLMWSAKGLVKSYNKRGTIWNLWQSACGDPTDALIPPKNGRGTVVHGRGGSARNTARLRGTGGEQFCRP